MALNFKRWIVFLLTPLVFAEADCDLPLAKNLKSLSLQTHEACRKHCQDSGSSCAAWVFVSGWNRCFLKAEPTKRKVKLIFEAGFREDATISLRSDSSGKDLRRVSGVKDAKQCQKHCKAESQCGSFTYMNGYGDCWLKYPGGNLYGKQFHCESIGG